MSERVETGLGVELGGINEFCALVNKESRARGWWEPMDNVLGGLVTGVRDKDIEFAVDAFTTQKIMLIVCELGEAVEAMRQDMYGLERKDTFEDELADALLRLFDLIGERGIDIEKQMAWKINYNRTREHMHGKSF
jgi:NTP pyrophosphatase (non-canonical NTP hydrolase)